MHVETITVGWSWEDGLKINLSFTKIPLRSRCLQHFQRVSLELQRSGGGEVFWLKWWQRDLHFSSVLLCQHIVAWNYGSQADSAFGRIAVIAGNRKVTWLTLNKRMCAQTKTFGELFPFSTAFHSFVLFLHLRRPLFLLGRVSASRSGSARALWHVK